MKNYRIIEIIIGLIMAVLGLLILLEKIEMSPFLAILMLIYGFYILISSIVKYKRDKKRK